MHKICISFLTFAIFNLTACSNSPANEAQSSVKSYIIKNLKNGESYEPVSFSAIDTLTKADTSETKQISLYKITHVYSVFKPDQDKDKITVSFYLDKDFEVTGKIMIFRKYKR